MPFKDMAKAMADNNQAKLDKRASEIDSMRKVLNGLFDMQKAQVDIQKAQLTGVQQSVKAEQQQEKIKADLISKYMAGKGQAPQGVPVDSFTKDREVDDQGLPILAPMGNR